MQPREITLGVKTRQGQAALHVLASAEKEELSVLCKGFLYPVEYACVEVRVLCPELEV